MRQKALDKGKVYDSEKEIAAFLEMKRMEGVTEGTLTQLRYALEALHEVKDRVPDTDDVKRCLPPEMNNSYFNKRLNAYRQFADFSSYLGGTVKRQIKNIRYKKPVIHIARHQECEVKKLLAAFTRTTFAGLRDYTLTVLLLDTGLRPTEALRITNEDVNLTLGEITVRAEICKTRQERIVPMSQVGISILKKFLAVQEEIDNPKTLFCSWEGGPIIAKRFGDRLRIVSLKAGVNITPYELRHIFATNYILNGGDVFSLARILGHTSIEMTKVYVNLDTSDLHKRHNEVQIFVSMGGALLMKNGVTNLTLCYKDHVGVPTEKRE